MAAVPRDIDIEQGATFRLAWEYHQQAVDPDTGELLFEADGVTPVLGPVYDLTGCTARAEVRRRPNTETTLIATSTDADDGITLGGVAGTIEWVISDEKSEAIGPLSRNLLAVYDFKLYWPSGDETRLLEGVATISPAVTKDPA